MDSYICVEPTSSPETPAPTDAPGCCYGDGYEANGMCKDMGCEMTTAEASAISWRRWAAAQATQAGLLLWRYV